MSSGRLRFRILTPARPVVDQQVDSANLTAAEGEVGLLPGHAPLLAALKAGPAWYRDGAETRWFAVGGGFVELSDDVVTVLVASAEAAAEIDVERARKRLAEREEQLKAQVLSDDNLRVAEASVLKQLVRIEVGSRQGSIP